MVTIHLLGHVYVSREQETLPVSRKGVALLCYLALEGRAQHRERLAGLLWNRQDAMKNLRVELTRLRGQGLLLFPPREPMLSLQAATDLQHWREQADDLRSDDLPGWLSVLRGVPLSGLEDLGSVAFGSWLDAQRWHLNSVVEDVLGRVHQRLLHEGHAEASELVRARAGLLGLQLPDQRPPPVRVDLRPEHGDLMRPLERLLGRAEKRPQLAILRGRLKSGRRAVIDQLGRRSGWGVIQVDARMSLPLLISALQMQLLRLLPPGEQRGALLRGVLPPDPDQALMRLAGAAVGSGLRLIVALHRIPGGNGWDGRQLTYLFSLPLPLLLVLVPDPGELDLWQPSLLDADRQVHLEMPSLTVSGVLRLAVEQAGVGTEPGVLAVQTEARRAWATRLVQQSDGWLLHARALEASPEVQVPPRGSLPPEVRESLLSELSGLPQLSAALARLSLLRSPLDAALTELLLPGPEGAALLTEAERRGFLTHVSAREEVQLPELTHRLRDGEARLTFADAGLRVALAGTMLGQERHQLRRTLAEFFRDRDPALSLHYAEQADLPELAAELHARRTPPPVVTPFRAPFTLEPPERAERVSSTPPRRAELRTPGGYRVAMEDGRLEVLRRGVYGQPPLLLLRLREVPPGSWSLVARLDIFDPAPALRLWPPAYPLGLRVGGGDVTVYSSESLPEFMDDGTLHVFGGVLPLAHWFSLRGESRGGLLELSCRALGVALTAHSLRWGEAGERPLSSP